MRVDYFISPGTPGHIPHGIGGATVADAVADFRAFVAECRRFGNEFKQAYMIVSSDRRPEMLYEVGPRGGIVRSGEW